MCRWIEQPSRHTTRRASSEPPAPARSRAPYRVSDAEREEVISQLRTHTADGRITLDEFETRVEEVLRAKTGPELDAALRELPPLPTAARAGQRTRPERQPLSPFARRLVAAAVLVAAVSLIVGHFGFWPFFIGFFVLGGPGCFRGHSHRAWHQREREDAVTYV